MVRASPSSSPSRSLGLPGLGRFARSKTILLLFIVVLLLLLSLFFSWSASTVSVSLPKMASRASDGLSRWTSSIIKNKDSQKSKTSVKDDAVATVAPAPKDATVSGDDSIYNGTWYKPGWSYDGQEHCVPDSQSKLSADQIQKAKSEWKAFLTSIESRIPRPSIAKVISRSPETASTVSSSSNASPSRGIVFTGHSGILKQFIRSVLVLRHHNCELPVEFWHYGEISEKEEKMITASLDKVTVRNMKNVKDSALKLKKEDGRMWEMKGAAMLHSSFDQVLFMDTDNMVARDPTFLFDSQPFRETGAVFWKDFGKLSRDNAIWAVLDIPCTTEFEQESGQVLIDKSRPDTLRAMYLAAYMQQERKLYFDLFWGDKETFRLAWRAVKAPYHMVRPHLAAVGVIKPQINKFCGHTMVQYSPLWIPSIYGPAPRGWTDSNRPEIMFMHANLFKYDHVQEDGKHFKTLMYYKHPEARKNEGGAFDSKHGLCTDMRTYTEDNGLVNEIVTEPLEMHLPNFESEFKKYEQEAKDFMNKV